MGTRFVDFRNKKRDENAYWLKKYRYRIKQYSQSNSQFPNAIIKSFILLVGKTTEDLINFLSAIINENLCIYQ